MPVLLQGGEQADDVRAVFHWKLFTHRYHQWRSQIFWCPGRVITMAAPNRKFEIKKSQLFITFPFIGSKF
jgi:hypothetical protein